VLGYHVAAAGLEQVRSLPAIELEASRLFPESHVPPNLRHVVTPQYAFASAQREGRLFTASTETGEVVGLALAGVMDGAAYLAELDVLPAHGRRGLGRKLIEAVIEWAERGGFAELTLATFRDLPWNAPYYARLGFEELAPAALGPALAAVLRREATTGLDPDKRLAMRRPLAANLEASLQYATRAGVGNAELNQLFRAAWPQHKQRDFESLLGHSALYVTAHLGPKLVGFVNVAWDGGQHGFILDPTVLPEHRLQGIGNALMRHAIAGARDRELVWLHVDFEPGLEAFYRKAGFVSSEAAVLRL